MKIKKAIELELSCAINLVDVQSEASGAEADGENEKVLCGHDLTSILDRQKLFSLGFFL